MLAIHSNWHLLATPNWRTHALRRSNVKLDVCLHHVNPPPVWGNKPSDWEGSLKHGNLSNVKLDVCLHHVNPPPVWGNKPSDWKGSLKHGNLSHCVAWFCLRLGDFCDGLSRGYVIGTGLI
jgi:hypothetical protein